MLDQDQEAETIATYDRHAQSWSDDHSNRHEDYKVIIHKLKRLLPSGTILEIGAGAGHDAAMLAEAGYSYFGTDASAGMVGVAQEMSPKLHFEQLNVYQLSELNRQFEGFWANAVLLHIPKPRIGEALQAISSVTKPGGVGFISLKDGDGEEFERREKSGRQENRIFAFWHREEFEKVLRAHGFEVVDYTYSPENERNQWHRFIVRKLPDASR